MFPVNRKRNLSYSSYPRDEKRCKQNAEGDCCTQKQSTSTANRKVQDIVFHHGRKRCLSGSASSCQEKRQKQDDDEIMGVGYENQSHAQDIQLEAGDGCMQSFTHQAGSFADHGLPSLATNVNSIESLAKNSDHIHQQSGNSLVHEKVFKAFSAICQMARYRKDLINNKLLSGEDLEAVSVLSNILCVLCNLQESMEALLCSSADQYMGNLYSFAKYLNYDAQQLSILGWNDITVEELAGVINPFCAHTSDGWKLASWLEEIKDIHRGLTAMLDSLTVYTQ